jgi:hypothetical protein
MIEKTSDVLERSRILAGKLASVPAMGMMGAFYLHCHKTGKELYVISSGRNPEENQGWEHVSVSLVRGSRCPNWDEMCFVKDLFWSEDEWVVQYHPAKADHINNHPGVLHLWKPVGVEIPIPPKEMV